MNRVRVLEENEAVEIPGERTRIQARVFVADCHDASEVVEKVRFSQPPGERTAARKAGDVQEEQRHPGGAEDRIAGTLRGCLHGPHPDTLVVAVLEADCPHFTLPESEPYDVQVLAETLPQPGAHFPHRSEERRVGKECRSRWSPAERSNWP